MLGTDDLASLSDKASKEQKALYGVFAPRMGPEANSKAPEETATQEVTNFLEVCKLKL